MEGGSSSNRSSHGGELLSGGLAVVPAAPLAAPPRPSFAREKWKQQLLDDNLKKQLFEPILVNKNERWLTPCGAPPRVDRPVAEGTNHLVSTSLRDEESTGSDVAALANLPTVPKRGSSTMAICRRPPLPRIAARRNPARARRALGDVCRKLPSVIAPPQIMADRPASPEAVTEAIYLRDMVGKDACVWRHTLDAEVNGRDEIFAEMAMYRMDATRAAQCDSREHAVRWRESHERQNRIAQLRWHLEHAGNLAKPAHALMDTSGAREDNLQPIPPRAPTPMLTRHKRFRPRLHRKQRARGESLATDIQSGSASESASDSDTEKKLPHNHGLLFQSSLRPKQSLEQRKSRMECNRQRRKAVKDQPPMVHEPTPVSDLMDASLNRSRAVINNLSADALSMLKQFGEKSQRLRRPQEVKQDNRSSLDTGYQRVNSLLMLPDEKESEVERARMLKVFKKYDKDGSNTLDLAELKCCLADLGLKGRNEFERTEIRKVLRSVNVLELTFDEFMDSIVATVRKRLAEGGEKRLRALFNKADINGNGMLSVEETVQLLRLSGTYPDDDQVLGVLQTLLPAVAANAVSIEGNWIMTRDVLDFEAFCTMMRMLRERTEAETVRRFSTLCIMYDLSEHEQELWKSSLVDLHAYFLENCEHQGKKPETINTHGYIYMLQDMGMYPKSRTVQNQLPQLVKASVNEVGEITFPAMLKVTELLQVQDNQRLLRIFLKHDVNNSAGLSLLECQRALAEAGCAAMTKEEEDAIINFIHEFDEDGSGEVDGDEFVNLVHFVSEKLHKHRREVERQTADRYGYDAMQLKQFRSVFRQLDQDGSHFLDMGEVNTAFDMLRRCQNGFDSTGVLTDLGFEPSDNEPKVDFLLFLKMMKAMDDREHMAALSQKYLFDHKQLKKALKIFNSFMPNRSNLVKCEQIEEWILRYGRGYGVSDAVMENVDDVLGTLPDLVDFEKFVKLLRTGEVELRHLELTCS